MNRPKGFSLIELLVVIAIIGLLSTMAVVSLNNARTKARDTRRMGDIKALQTAVEVYKTQQSTDLVPTSASWTALGTDLAAYMTAVPTDPNNTGTSYYVYCRDTTTGNGNKYLIGGPLEQNLDVPGDLDTAWVAGTTTNWACIKSFAGALPAATPATGISCADSNGGNLTAAGSQTVFCLGSM